MSLRNTGGVGMAIIGSQGHNGARREHLPEARVLYWLSGCLDAAFSLHLGFAVPCCCEHQAFYNLFGEFMIVDIS